MGLPKMLFLTSFRDYLVAGTFLLINQVVSETIFIAIFTNHKDGSYWLASVSSGYPTIV
jgi:hypothetical protein